MKNDIKSSSNLRHTEQSHDKDKDIDREKKKKEHFVILWGSHHKTGTYLAQKVFALICSRQKWCCVFQPTRYDKNQNFTLILCHHCLGYESNKL
jgi:hypothetical protein